MQSIRSHPVIRKVYRFFRPNVRASIPWPEENLHLSVHEGGGFYDAYIGERLNARYSITRKLGWGQHSSVWLARDDR